MRQIVKLHSFRFGIRFEKVVEFMTICGQVSVSEWRILLPDCVIDRVIVILLVDQHRVCFLAAWLHLIDRRVPYLDRHTIILT